MNAVAVRIYVAQPDGELELLLEADTDYFGGSCPSVGDVLSFFSDTRHFRIESRHFHAVKGARKEAMRKKRETRLARTRALEEREKKR